MVLMRLKLPKVQPPKVEENLVKWNTFRDYFYSTIHTNNSLRKIDKFQYLVSILEGRARMAIEYLLRNDEMYQKAIDILAESFGDRGHLQQQLNLQKKRNFNNVEKF